MEVGFQGHVTKMATIPIYGKKPKLLCPVTVLVDSKVSDRCPWATCFILDLDIKRTTERKDLRQNSSDSDIFVKEIHVSIAIDVATTNIVIKLLFKRQTKR